MNPNHPALKKLHFRSTEKEVDQAMHEAGAPSYRYPKDGDFENFVLKDIKTLEQGKAIIALLNADRHAKDGNRKFSCQKTWRLKNLAKDMKKYKSFSAAWFLSSARRTDCSCHETCSFALK